MAAYSISLTTCCTCNIHERYGFFYYLKQQRTFRTFVFLIVSGSEPYHSSTFECTTHTVSVSPLDLIHQINCLTKLSCCTVYAETIYSKKSAIIHVVYYCSFPALRWADFYSKLSSNHLESEVPIGCYRECFPIYCSQRKRGHYDPLQKVYFIRLKTVIRLIF